ncbi:MAG: hypothetical protein HZB36_05540 [Candidatus Omnitrophica bacterium]|nr:hypothetical protein [Candidatus Omnitrophota bacterium]
MERTQKIKKRINGILAESGLLTDRSRKSVSIKKKTENPIQMLVKEL